MIRIWKPLSTPAHKDTLDRPLYTYLHNHYRLYSFSGLGSHSDECRYQPLVLPCTTFLVRGTKTQATNQLDDSQRITTVTAKSVIVQQCFRPNQLLTGSMWSARGVHRLNAALHKEVLFQSCLSAKCSQPHIAHDRHTGVNGGSCWANSETYCHCQIQILFAFDNTRSNLLHASYFLAIPLTFFCALNF